MVERHFIFIVLIFLGERKGIYVQCLDDLCFGLRITILSSTVKYRNKVKVCQIQIKAQWSEAQFH